MNTLRERYVQRQQEMLLMEAINDNDLKAVTAVISKLKRADLSAMPNIDNLVNDVVNELNKMLAKGGKQTGAVGFLKRLFTKGESALQGPVGKALALITSLEAGFKALPTIIAANVKANDPGIKDRSLADVAGNNRGPLDQAIKQAFIKSPLTLKGIKLDDSQLADIVDDIMAAKLGIVAQTSKTMSSGPSGIDAVTSLMKTMTSTGGKTGTQVNGTEETEKGQLSKPTEPGTTQTQETLPATTNKKPLNNKQMSQKLRKALGDAKIDVNTFNKVYRALKNNGIELKWGNQNINIAA